MGTEPASCPADVWLINPHAGIPIGRSLVARVERY